MPPRPRLTYEAEMEIALAYFEGKRASAIAKATGYSTNHIYKIRDKHRETIFKEYPHLATKYDNHSQSVIKNMQDLRKSPEGELKYDVARKAIAAVGLELPDMDTALVEARRLYEAGIKPEILNSEAWWKRQKTPDAQAMLSKIKDAKWWNGNYIDYDGNVRSNLFLEGIVAQKATEQSTEWTKEEALIVAMTNTIPEEGMHYVTTEAGDVPLKEWLESEEAKSYLSPATAK